MLANRFPALSRRQCLLMALGCAALPGGTARASRPWTLTVLTPPMADDTSAEAEFVRQLREIQDEGRRFSLVRLPAGETALDDLAPASGPPDLTLAVGLRAARSALERPGPDPLLLAMLSRLDYQSLQASAALRRPARRIGVLLREPALANQLALIDAVLPARRRLGVVASTESEPIVDELQRAALGWQLQVEYAAHAKSLAPVLRLLVARSDALLVLPDRIGDSQAATLAVLRAGAGAGVPVFGGSEGLVRSGGLAAAVSTPGQLARQAQALGRKLMTGGPGLLVESATPASVRVNATVARGLDLRLPDERELAARVSGAR
jgi:putative ABC transport system substrate-binding protein